MARRQMWCMFFGLCFFFTVAGCAAVSKSIDNYKAYSDSLWALYWLSFRSVSVLGVALRS